MGVQHLTSQAGDNGDDMAWLKPAPAKHPFGGKTAGGGHNGSIGGAKLSGGLTNPMQSGGSMGSGNHKSQIGGQPFTGKPHKSAGRAG